MSNANPSLQKSAGSTIIPGMRYRNATTAIEWLCNAFGFEKHLVVPGEDGAIVHAQLTFGTGMVMLGSVRDTEFHRNMKQPDEIGGAETQSCYVVVTDCDAHYTRAKAAGAAILIDIHDEGYGGRGYSCRDIEGHIWYFGTYNPWQAERT